MTNAETTTNGKPATVAAPAAQAAPKGKPAGKEATPKTGAPKGTKPAKKANPAKAGKAARKPAATPREGSKKAEVIELLRRKQGATLPEIMKVTDWKAHSVRGFISGALIKQQGLKIESFRNKEEVRTYRITA